MGQSNGSTFLATSEGQAVILGREIGILPVRGGVSRFYQRRAQPLTPFAGLATEAFSSTFMIARTHSCPGGQVLSTGEALHVGSDLGQDHFRQTPLDARNGFQARQQFLIRLKPLSHLGAEPSNALLELGEVFQVLR